VVIDAAQGLGQVPMDVHRCGCDVVVATGRKWLCGPRTTAVLWLSPNLDIAMSANTVGPADRNVAIHLGLGVALREARETGVYDRLHAQTLEAAERAHGLGLRMFAGTQPCTGALTLAIPKASQAAVDAALQANGIVAKWPDAARDEPLAVDSAQQAACPLRLTPHLYNTSHDIERALEVIAQALATA